MRQLQKESTQLFKKRHRDLLSKLKKQHKPRHLARESPSFWVLSIQNKINDHYPIVNEMQEPTLQLRTSYALPCYRNLSRGPGGWRVRNRTLDLLEEVVVAL